MGFEGELITSTFEAKIVVPNKMLL